MGTTRVTGIARVTGRVTGTARLLGGTTHLTKGVISKGCSISLGVGAGGGSSKRDVSASTVARVGGPARSTTDSGVCGAASGCSASLEACPSLSFSSSSICSLMVCVLRYLRRDCKALKQTLRLEARLQGLETNTKT